MIIDIRLGRSKRESTILIDGQIVRRGIVDFDVDLSDQSPKVTLKIMPERLVIAGDLGRVTAMDLGAWRGRRALRLQLRYACVCFFRSLRSAGRELHGLWREAHPSNREPFPPSF